MDRRAFLGWAAGGAALGAVPRWVRAQEAPPFREVIPEQVEAVRKGLAWLASHQASRGSIGAICQVAFTSIAGLAFMAGGSTPTRGPHSSNVRRAAEFILRCCRRDGYINESGNRVQGGSGMHGHGYGLLFLSELYGMCAGMREARDIEGEVRDAIARAVRITAQAQDPNGGWTYDPVPRGHEGSVTVTQVQALRAARNAGFLVPRSTIERGISYIRMSTAADGTILYSLGRGGSGTFALTAAGACVYAYYGIHQTPEAQRCMKSLMDFLTRKRPGRESHEYYASFYAGQACFFMKRQDPKYWSDGFEVVRKQLLETQDHRGGWVMDGYGGAFGTGCATLVLQIPFRLLPIFQD